MSREWAVQFLSAPCHMPPGDSQWAGLTAWVDSALERIRLVIWGAFVPELPSPGVCAEEVDLIGEYPLERLAVVHLEVAGRVAPQLPAGCPLDHPRSRWSSTRSTSSPSVSFPGGLEHGDLAKQCAGTRPRAAADRWRDCGRSRGRPAAGVRRPAVLRPLAHRDGERLLDRVLGEIDLPEDTDQGRQRPAGLLANTRPTCAAPTPVTTPTSSGPSHAPRESCTARTSIGVPMMAVVFDAHDSAASRSSTSMR